MPKTAPFGTWSSPITSDSIVQSSTGADEIFVDPVTSTVYHIERRPAENGRNVIVKTEEGVDLVGKGWNCRTGVQEYGGAAATAYDGSVIFSNFTDSRAYKVTNGGEPEAITPVNDVHRFACFAVHPKHTHIIVAVLEDHTRPAPSDVVTTLCVIDSNAKSVSPLVSGADFYAKPAFSSDGSHLIWQQWFFPDMPWEGAELHVAHVSVHGPNHSSVALSHDTHFAGKRLEISVGYPSWVSDDVIMFTSDVSGYQNPWTYTLSTQTAAPVLPTPVAEDFSKPEWTLGDSPGAIVDKVAKMALFTAMRDGRDHLYVFPLHCGTLEEIECPYNSIKNVRAITHEAAVFIAGKEDESSGIILCTLKDYAKPIFTVLKSSTLSNKDFSSEYISKPQPMTLKMPPNDEPVHVVFYPPTNPEFVGPQGEKPPCVLNVHGGPTGYASQSLNLTIQYFTSRGWAWLDVNYGGSSGYGRAYIERLKGQWGIVDVRDCVQAASILATSPYSLINPAHTAIRGGSSGGYTALAAVCSYPHAFSAATSLYGISDLKKLEEFSHKFESQYMTKLLGGTYAQIPEVYRERSPVYNADKIRAPLLILQGLLDAVVPPDQAETIVKAIKANGGHVEYVAFEGEGHGWRKAETIKAALEKEIGFYESIFGLKA